MGRLLWGAALLLVIGMVGLLAWRQVRQQRLPPIRPPVLFAIPEFTLTNQLGRPVARADLRGSVWVADIIFTRCAGPCPKMTQRMSELQAALPADQPVKLITLTTDASHDTPAVLRAYGERYDARPEQWWFLTGDPRAIANLAMDGFKFVAVEKPAAERTDPADLFVHSTFYVVVDKQGRARAVFDYDEPDMPARLLETVQALLRE